METLLLDKSLSSGPSNKTVTPQHPSIWKLWGYHGLTQHYAFLLLETIKANFNNYL